MAPNKNTATNNTNGTPPAAAEASNSGNSNANTNGTTPSPAAPNNPPCPTAPSLSREKYDEIRQIMEPIMRTLPPGSYFTITEDTPGGGHTIRIMAREPFGCPPNCQHCQDEIAAYGVPRWNPDGN